MEILNLMKALGYTINEDGMCYGIAFMAIQAIIRNDVNTYINRLKFINRYDCKLINYEVKVVNLSPNSYKQKTIYMHVKTKEYSFHYDNEGNDEFISGMLSTEVASLIESIELPTPCKKGLEKKLKDFLAIELLAHHIKKAEDSRAKNSVFLHMNMLLSIKPWLEGIAIYFGLKIPGNLSLKENNIWQKNTDFLSKQNWQTANDFFNPEPVHKNARGKRIQLIHTMIGIYDENFMDLLITEIKASREPIAFSISSASHTIAIGGSIKGVMLINHDWHVQGCTSQRIMQSIAQPGAQCVPLSIEKFTSDAVEIAQFESDNLKKIKLKAISLLKEYTSNNPFRKNILTRKHKGRANNLRHHLNQATSISEINILIKNELSLFTCHKGIERPQLNSSSNINTYFNNHFGKNIKNIENLGSYYRILETINDTDLYVNQVYPLDYSISDLEIKGKNEETLLYLALQNGHTEAVRAYVNAILNADISAALNKLTLLEAKDSKGTPGLFMALQKGHTETVKVYIQAVLESTSTNQTDKFWILLARSKHSKYKFPGLYLSLQNGHTETVKVYIQAVLESNIKLEDKLYLLDARRKDGRSGLYMALANRHIETVKTYMHTILTIEKLILNKNLRLLTAMGENETRSFYHILYSGYTETVKVYLSIILESINITETNKLTILKGSKDELYKVLLLTSMEFNKYETVKAYISAVQEANISQKCKNTLLPESVLKKIKLEISKHGLEL
ncbi:hypothetical protein IB643_02480 [Allofrancisella guangzhouensis]|uniref:hypothetical protein n=1 Tax=Allofrancisella guangzhouensis TaxID=594679 RepID=UPI0019069F8D|nr:hypothetical protein [Allofrancisella guangzhouensis]MBK2027024.1 hypothetical protein [Allofrancisella guangzhouensis]MBK2046154.1 hypothetical protein [Allofrancisella guangzhouensis]